MQYLLIFYFLIVAIMFVFSTYHHYYNKIEFLGILIEQDLLGLKLSEIVANYFYIFEFILVLLSLFSIICVWYKLYFLPFLVSLLLFLVFLVFLVYLVILYIFMDYRNDCGCFAFKFMLDYKHLWFNTILVVLDVIVMIKLLLEVLK